MYLLLEDSVFSTEWVCCEKTALPSTCSGQWLSKDLFCHSHMFYLQLPTVFFFLFSFFLFHSPFLRRLTKARFRRNSWFMYSLF